jgi:hypothetical protein
MPAEQPHHRLSRNPQSPNRNPSPRSRPRPRRPRGLKSALGSPNQRRPSNSRRGEVSNRPGRPRPRLRRRKRHGRLRPQRLPRNPKARNRRGRLRRRLVRPSRQDSRPSRSGRIRPRRPPIDDFVLTWRLRRYCSAVGRLFPRRQVPPHRRPGADLECCSQSERDFVE